MGMGLNTLGGCFEFLLMYIGKILLKMIEKKKTLSSTYKCRVLSNNVVIRWEQLILELKGDDCSDSYIAYIGQNVPQSSCSWQGVQMEILP